MTNENPTSDNSKNPLQRRQDRQKRIKKIMQWCGYPTGGLGIAGTIALFKVGEPILAIITAFVSLGLIVVAIAFLRI